MNDVDVERRSIGELLALVAGVPRAPAELVERAGGLEQLARADAFEIAAHWRAAERKRAPARAAPALAAAFELGRRAAIAGSGALVQLRSPAAVAEWAMPRIGRLAHEELWLLAVDSRSRLRAARCVAKGGLHRAAIRAADPLRAALRLDTSAFILVHNHPSGDPTPSVEDVALTDHVATAAAIVGIVLLDHVVVAHRSFACVPIPPPLEPRPSVLSR